MLVSDKLISYFIYVILNHPIIGVIISVCIYHINIFLMKKFNI